MIYPFAKQKSRFIPLGQSAFPPKRAYQTERGRRDENQDMLGLPEGALSHQLGQRVWGVRRPKKDYASKGYLYLLADGVGGAARGELASQFIIEAVGYYYYEAPVSADIAKILHQAIEKANAYLYHYQQENNLPGMSTTLVAAVFSRSGEVTIANVGDSRAYHIQTADAELITSDHSWVDNQVRLGLMTESQAEVSNQRNRITRSLGGYATVGVDVFKRVLQPKERILLCSDGLSSYVSAQQIGRLARQRDLQKAVNRLIDTAYDNGSSDNISAILFEAI